MPDTKVKRSLRYLTDDERDLLGYQIGAALHDGLGTKEIADLLGCTCGAVAAQRTRMHSEGYHTQTRRNAKRLIPTTAFSDDQRREIVSYYKTHSIRDTSAKYQIRPECISRLAIMEGYYKPPGRPSASNRLLGDLGLRLIAQRVPGSTHMHTYHLDHIISSRRLRISKTDYRNIRKGAASWLKEHADKVSAALRA